MMDSMNNVKNDCKRKGNGQPENRPKPSLRISDIDAQKSSSFVGFFQGFYLVYDFDWLRYKENIK